MTLFRYSLFHAIHKFQYVFELKLLLEVQTNGVRQPIYVLWHGYNYLGQERGTNIEGGYYIDSRP